MPVRFERCSTEIRDFHSERNVVQRQSTPDETRVGVLTAQGQGRRQKLSPNFAALNRPERPRRRLEAPKGNRCKR